MATRKRDYKAEYARRKAAAERVGSTPWKLRRMKEQGLLSTYRTQSKRERRRNETPHQKQRRREAKEWSRKHSQQETSSYRDSMEPWQVEAFDRAFVDYDPRTPHQVHMDNLYHYLVEEQEYYTPEEFDEKYGEPS